MLDRTIGDRRGEAIDLGNLGNVNLALGKFHEAIAFYQQRLALAREFGEAHGEAGALFNLSVAFAKLNDLAQAIPHAEAALKIYEQIEASNAVKVRELLQKWRQ